MILMVDIVPEANFGIMTCKNGTKERNAIFLVAEADYMLWHQTTILPYPKILFSHIVSNNNAVIVRE